MNELNKLVELYNSIQLNCFIKSENVDIFHYTSPSVLNDILNKHELRFTDRQYLNDMTEGMYVLDKCINMLQNSSESFYKNIIKFCKKRKNNLNSRDFYVYQISFSLDEDNLCLWNYYTRGNSIKGYNLKFNSEDLIGKLNIKPKLPSGTTPKPIGGKIIYDDEEQQKIIQNIIDQFKNFSNKQTCDDMLFELLVDKLLMVGSFFKPKEFEVEHEYRIILDLFIKENGDIDTIDNQPGSFERNGYLIPFVDIGFDTHCLQGITISPTLNDDVMLSSILRKAKKCNDSIKKDSIKKSKIPLRY